MTLKAVVSGHICADLYPKLKGEERIIPGAIVAVGPLTILPGGCVANTGRDLHSLGAPVQLVGDVGDDELGSSLVHMLSESGLDCRGIRPVSGAATSYSLVFEPPGRDRAFWHHVGANSSFDGDRVKPDKADLVHLGYPPLLPAMYAAGGAALQSLLARIRESGATTSLDLSTVAAGSRAGQVDWEGLLTRTVPLVDVLSPSVDDVVERAANCQAGIGGGDTGAGTSPSWSRSGGGAPDRRSKRDAPAHCECRPVLSCRSLFCRARAGLGRPGVLPPCQHDPPPCDDRSRRCRDRRLALRGSLRRLSRGGGVNCSEICCVQGRGRGGSGFSVWDGVRGS